MASTLAFDVYGALIDPFDVSTKLSEYVGDKASQFAQIWRDKQIAYPFRRGLMREYRDFATCTHQSLMFTDEHLQTNLSAEAMEALTAQYRKLPAYPNVPQALEQFKVKNRRMYTFSNGQPDDLEHLLEHAGLSEHLDGFVSVHDVQSYKPDPAVYKHFLDSTNAAASDTWLVSGNAFDIIGAHAAGWQTAWVKRDPTAVFDPWDTEPTVTVAEPAELADAL